jgi:hypothetical protein
MTGQECAILAKILLALKASDGTLRTEVAASMIMNGINIAVSLIN